MQYKTVCVAGTFDGLHRGHETLLAAAFENGKHIIIAVTSDVFVRAYKGDGVASYEIRKNALEVWLDRTGFISRAEIIMIDDPVGPAATIDIDALIVTSQNHAMGEKINTLRVQQNRKPVALIDVSLVPADDHQLISSTRIRRGEIDTTGRLVMPDNMREELAQPLGDVLVDTEMIATSLANHKHSVIISVGDQTTKTLVDHGISPNLAIIDNQVNRKAFGGLVVWLSGKKDIREPYVSGPGYISTEAVFAIKRWADNLHNHLILEIDGEEDLLVLPVIDAVPVGCIVYYGQPGRGMVEVLVTAQNKKIAKALLAKFIH